jgi:Glycosyl transferase family 2
MGMPLVSVLMPVFNGQQYLDAALSSIFVQSFSDFEFLVVDDGSTDETPQILHRCNDPRLRVIRIDHVGLIGALNEGIAHCSAPLIARMDADDLSYRDRLKCQFEYLCNNPSVDVVTSWSDLIDESGRVIGRRTECVSDDMVLELAAGNQIVHGSVMFRRDRLPPDPVYLKPPEDYWLWANLAHAGRRFHCLPEVHYAFRTHNDRYSLSHARTQSAGIVEVQWPLLEECSTNRDINDLSARGRLVRGWGGVAGAAYRSGDRTRANEARRKFVELADHDWEELAPAVHYGIEAMIWGGCRWYEALGLRWREWKQQPTLWKSYRNLLLCLPPIQWLRKVVARAARLQW